MAMMTAKEHLGRSTCTVVVLYGGDVFISARATTPANLSIHHAACAAWRSVLRRLRKQRDGLTPCAVLERQRVSAAIATASEALDAAIERRDEWTVDMGRVRWGGRRA